MTQNEFISYIAAVAVKDWQDRRLVLPSLVIAQAIKESAWGTSELAINANAIFGVKKNGWTGETYIKNAGEQNTDGTRVVVAGVEWRKYESWYDSIIDHNTYIAERQLSGQSEPNFKSVIGECDIKKAIAGLIGEQYRIPSLPYITDTELLAYVAAGTTEYPYATSLTYAQSLLSDYVIKYNLAQYDDQKDRKMIINVHAGHNPDGMIACGAIGLIKESTEARAVKNRVIELLRAQGHTVRDCTCNNGTSQSDVLAKIVTMCNTVSADLDISIHFNAGSGDTSGNGSTTGAECWIYPGSASNVMAENICSKISKLGFKNRGVKTSNGLYVLKNTKAPAILIECCFVDDTDDCNLYNADKVAAAIVEGITGVATSQESDQEEKILYRVQVGAYNIRSNAVRKVAEMTAKGINAIIIEEKQ